MLAKKRRKSLCPQCPLILRIYKIYAKNKINFAQIPVILLYVVGFQGGILNKIIDIVATGSGQDLELFQYVKTLLEQKGFAPRHSPTIFQDDPLYSAPDSVRLENFLGAVRGQNSNIIWSARGGCGTKRLLPQLELLPPPKNTKTLIGFSDVTALLIFVTQKWGWQSIHGPTLNYFSKDRLSPKIQDMMFSFCQGRKIQVVHDQLIPLNAHAEKIQALEAPVTGGNMSVLEYSIGTSWEIKTNGHLLFFEDIDEAPYRIAERLDHYHQAGLLKNIMGILFGDFSHQKHPIDQGLLNHVLKEFAIKQDCPVYANFKSGHHENNLPVEIGGSALIQSSDKGVFSLRQDFLIR